MAESGHVNPTDRRKDSQLELDLHAPTAREYRSVRKSSKLNLDIGIWLSRVTALASAVSLGLLVFLIVFADPVKGWNVLAVTVTIAFGVLFSVWSFEHWIHQGNTGNSHTDSTWSITRHAILAAAAVTALVGGAINGTSSLGLLAMITVTVVIADLVLQRVRFR